MSIGKSSLKRVENNGYSKVKTDAPDMQNSHVITAPAEEVTEKLIAPIEQKNSTPKRRRKNRARRKRRINLPLVCWAKICLISYFNKSERVKNETESVSFFYML